jgi:hypothetical protein
MCSLNSGNLSESGTEGARSPEVDSSIGGFNTVLDDATGRSVTSPTGILYTRPDSDSSEELDT